MLTTKTKRSRAETERRLIDVALDLILTKGVLAGLNLREVADRPDPLGDVRVGLGDLGLDALEQLSDVLGLIELPALGLREDGLRELSADELLVVAGALGCAETAVDTVET